MGNNPPSPECHIISMHKIITRLEFCLFDTWIGQLDRIMEKKESFGKNGLFLKHTFVHIINKKHCYATWYIDCTTRVRERQAAKP